MWQFFIRGQRLKQQGKGIALGSDLVVRLLVLMDCSVSTLVGQLGRRRSQAADLGFGQLLRGRMLGFDGIDGDLDGRRPRIHGEGDLHGGSVLSIRCGYCRQILMGNLMSGMSKIVGTCIHVHAWFGFGSRASRSSDVNEAGTRSFHASFLPSHAKRVWPHS